MIRLTRSAKGKVRLKRPPLFTVYLDGEVLIETTTPLSAGARALLDKGYDPAELLTVRVEDRDCDTFKPITIGDAAKWMVVEEDRRGLRLRPYKPFHGAPGGREAPPARKSPSPLPFFGTQKRIEAGGVHG